MLADRPKGELGPAYAIAFDMPGPNSEIDVIRMDLYPYAPNGPVTYTKPGQPFFRTQETRGGWFQAPRTLKRTLISAGLPATAPPSGGRVAPPASGGRSTFWSLSATQLATAAISTVLLVLAGSVFVLRRRLATAH